MLKKAKRWTRTRLSGYALSLTVLLCLIGCGTTAPRVVLVPSAIWVDGLPETAVRTAEPVEAFVYVKEGDEWIKSSNRVTIPDGWYAVSPPPAKKEKP